VKSATAIYIDGSLIKAADLVNGLNITQCAPEGMHIIEYLHIELSTHDVIYAEGATAETFWPFWCQSSHDQFDNFAEYYRLYGNQNEYPPCPPRFSGDRPDGLRGTCAKD
jgi:hypothetical protein